MLLRAATNLAKILQLGSSHFVRIRRTFLISPGTNKLQSLSQKMLLRISRYKTDKNVPCFPCSFPWAFYCVYEGRKRQRGILGEFREKEPHLVEISQCVCEQKGQTELCLFSMGLGVPPRAQTRAGQAGVSGKQGKEKEKQLWLKGYSLGF